jgi:hypothetical protein
MIESKVLAEYERELANPTKRPEKSTEDQQKAP